jgi:hypothetical protein
VASEEEWSSLATFETGTWDEFKEELIANYPEAAASERYTSKDKKTMCRYT